MSAWRAWVGLVLTGATTAPAAAPVFRAERLPANPVISPAMLPGDDGDSITGPAMIRVPAWVKRPLGKYYLYFAHHNGKYIRFAYADRPEGPWTMRAGGVLRMEDQKILSGHIASPDVVVDDAAQRIFLFYHGRPPTFQKRDLTSPDRDPEAGQKTAAAISDDGVAFNPLETIVGPAYLRVFPFGGRWFALNHSGELRMALKLGQPFEPVAQIVGDDIVAAVDPLRLGEPGAPRDRPRNGADRYGMRHIGVDVFGQWLTIYFSCVGHRPERILRTTVEMKGEPATWRARGVADVIRPETDWEGANFPLAYSKGGRSREPERGLRDPAVFRDGAEAWLVYATAGEHGLGIARLMQQASP